MIDVSCRRSLVEFVWAEQEFVWAELRLSVPEFSFRGSSVSVTWAELESAWVVFQGEFSFWSQRYIWIDWISVGWDSERVPSSGGVSGDPFGFVVKGGEIHAYTLSNLKSWGGQFERNFGNQDDCQLMVSRWLPIVVANVWWSEWLPTTLKGEIVVPSGVCVVVVGTNIEAFVSWHNLS